MDLSTQTSQTSVRTLDDGDTSQRSEKDSPPLLFVVGSGRSGTTWLGKIFDSHPDTLYRHEPDTWQDRDDLPAVVMPEQTQQYARIMQDFVEGLPLSRDPRIGTKLPLFPKSYYSPLRFRLRQLCVAGAKAGGHIGLDLAVPHLFEYRNAKDLRVIWKSINSTGRVGLVASAIENSRTVVIVRHPCGHAASWLRGKQGGHFTGTTHRVENYMRDLLDMPHARTHRLTEEAFKAMPPLEKHIWAWVLSNEKMMLDIEDRDDCTLIRYEDLCAQPLEVSQRLFEWAELSWNDQTEAFIKESTSNEDDGYYSVFKNPLSSAQRWREELSEKDVERILAVAQGSLPGRLYEDE